MRKPRAVIMGQDIVAGLDPDNLSELKYAIVVKFDSSEQLRKALRDNLIELEDDLRPTKKD